MTKEYLAELALRVQEVESGEGHIRIHNDGKVYMDRMLLESLFPLSVLTIERNESPTYPFRRIVTFEGVKFFCILAISELTEEEKRYFNVEDF